MTKYSGQTPRVSDPYAAYLLAAPVFTTGIRKWNIYLIYIFFSKKALCLVLAFRQYILYVDVRLSASAGGLSCALHIWSSLQVRRPYRVAVRMLRRPRLLVYPSLRCAGC